jgi:PsbP-like protein
MNTLILLAIVIGSLLLVSNNVYGEIVNTTDISTNSTDFSIDIPDNWTFEETVFGNRIFLTPNEFGVLLASDVSERADQLKNGGVMGEFQQDLLFPIKNAGLDVYVQYIINEQKWMNVTSKQNVTIDNEPPVKILGDGTNSSNHIKFAGYMTMRDEKPYYIGYMANVKDFEKYLPEFEQIVKTFKFAK